LLNIYKLKIAKFFKQENSLSSDSAFKEDDKGMNLILQLFLMIYVGVL